MKVYAVTGEQLMAVVAKVSNKRFEGNLTFKTFQPLAKFVNFTLRVNNSKGEGAKITRHGRHTIAATWEAHRDVMTELFNQHPEAKLVSCRAKYNGKADFEAKFAETAY